MGTGGGVRQRQRGAATATGTRMRGASDAGSQRRCGQHREHGLVAGRRVLVVSGGFFEQPLDSTGGARQRPRHLVGVRWL